MNVQLLGDNFRIVLTRREAQAVAYLVRRGLQRPLIGDTDRALGEKFDAAMTKAKVDSDEE